MHICQSEAFLWVACVLYQLVMKATCYLQVCYVKCRLAKWWHERTLCCQLCSIMNVSYAHQAFIYWIKNTEENCNILKYYYNLKECFSILIYLNYNLFLWCKAEFSASFLMSSVHDPSEIILICWFIINIGNRCPAYFYLLLYKYFWNLDTFWGFIDK